jgi:hypothetical protein
MNLQKGGYGASVGSLGPSPPQLQRCIGYDAPSLHPLTIREWREKNRGTHAVMGVMHLEKGRPAKDVADDWDNFHREFKGVDS